MKVFHWLILTVILGFTVAKDDYTPKPHGYPRIDFPERKYVEYNSDCPHIFNYPVYAEVVKDSGRYRASHAGVNIHFKPFDATLLAISYKHLTAWPTWIPLSMIHTRWLSGTI